MNKGDLSLDTIENYGASTTMYELNNECGPLFETAYTHIQPLKNKHILHQDCLREHTLNMSPFYKQTCNCTHLHVVSSTGTGNIKQACSIDYKMHCSKCNTENKLLVPAEVLMYHPNFNEKNLKICIHNGPEKSCVHIHYPPCNNCEFCCMKKKCMFTKPFECIYTDSTYCYVHSHFTTDVENNSLFKYHKYLTKDPKLYYCIDHTHLHQNEIECNVYSTSCCPKAKLLHECNNGFILNVNKDPNCKNNMKNPYVIYNPVFWEDQAYTHFYSLIRAVIINPKSINSRYKQYQNSKFKIGNIKEYKSGKSSIIRKSVTGFSAHGAYQTGIISNTGHARYLVLPHKLFDLLEKDFDISLAVVKRDPSIYVTSAHVVRILRNVNSDIKVVILANQLAKTMNQDQDGDNDTIVFLPKKKNGFNFQHTMEYKIAKLEMSMAFQKSITLLSGPRISLSECDLVLLERGHKLLNDDPFYQQFKTDNLSYRDMLELGISIRKEEFDTMYRKIDEINSMQDINCLTVDDILLKTNILSSIVTSGAKGTMEHLKMLIDGLQQNPDLQKLQQKMINQFKLYILSSRNLRLTGRSQFSSLYAIHDLVILNGIVCFNKYPLADFKTCGFLYTFMFPKAAIEQTILDLERL